MTCDKCGKPNPSASAWCDYCRDEEAGFPAHTRERAREAVVVESKRRFSWRLRGHR